MKLRGRRFETVFDIQRESEAVLVSIKENDFHGYFWSLEKTDGIAVYVLKDSRLDFKWDHHVDVEDNVDWSHAETYVIKNPTSNFAVPLTSFLTISYVMGQFVSVMFWLSPSWEY
jgi:hypothetical protein